MITVTDTTSLLSSVSLLISLLWPYHYCYRTVGDVIIVIAIEIVIVIVISRDITTVTVTVIIDVSLSL